MDVKIQINMHKLAAYPYHLANYNSLLLSKKIVIYTPDFQLIKWLFLL